MHLDLMKMMRHTIFYLVLLFAIVIQTNGKCDSGRNCNSEVDNNEKPDTPAPVSERKCKEYSSAVYETTVLLPLGLSFQTTSVKSAKCVYDGTQLIVGGVNAKLGEFPHAAAIGWDLGGKYAFSCGGSLISPRFVLTAAHCAKARGIPNPDPAVVRLGDLNIDPTAYDGASPIDVRINKIHINPLYKRNRQYNDIALIELEEEVQFNDNIRPACLWTSNNLGNNTKAVAVGWGITNSTTQTKADILQKVSLDLFKNEDCNVTLRDSFNRKWEGFSDSQICAGVQEGQQDTCQGDSGSPLQVVSEENHCVFHVIGVTAKGKAFCGYGPAVYTRVSSFLNWIEGIVWPEGV